MNSAKQTPQISIGKYIIKGTNHQELLGIKKEIFDESIYYLDLDNQPLRILDIGAHVGLATLYFKRSWPGAKVTCIEPHPVNYALLKENLWFNRLDDVITVEAAVGDREGEQTLYFDSTDDQWLSTAGFIDGAWNHQQQSQPLMVKTVLLDNYIDGSIDLLKIDIEGAEVPVLEVARRLHLVKHLIVELHPQNFRETSPLIRILEKQHFSVTVIKTHFGLSRLKATRR